MSLAADYPGMAEQSTGIMFHYLVKVLERVLKLKRYEKITVCPVKRPQTNQRGTPRPRKVFDISIDSPVNTHNYSRDGICIDFARDRS